MCNCHMMWHISLWYQSRFKSHCHLRIAYEWSPANWSILSLGFIWHYVSFTNIIIFILSEITAQSSPRPRPGPHIWNRWHDTWRRSNGPDRRGRRYESSCCIVMTVRMSSARTQPCSYSHGIDQELQEYSNDEKMQLCFEIERLILSAI